MFGLQDGFVRAAMLVLVSGSLTLLESWPPYGVMAVTGLALAQNAFEAAPLRACLPAVTVFEHVVALEAAGLIALIIGVVMLTRSPLPALQQPPRQLAGV
ncbi:MAG TPA: hypothetical protein VJS67_10935 [Pseudonocardiaceae bacterium]|nr:hypothetical protein [Pseudonocardiaceae bacterium]